MNPQSSEVKNQILSAILPAMPALLRQAILLLALASVTGATWAQENILRAAYYDKRGNLVHCEDVSMIPNSTLKAARVLRPLGHSFPRFRETDWAKYPCMSPVQPIAPESKIAVYYGIQGSLPPAGTSDVLIDPMYQEDLSASPSRPDYVCARQGGNHDCVFPKVCVCRTAPCPPACCL